MITDYLSDMPNMLKKLYLTLKGYDKAPPSLTEEYLEVMKKSKAKGITWFDKDSENDAHFKFISNLDLDKPSMMIDYDFETKDADTTIDLDSEDLTDTENRPIVTSTKKRKGTPIKLTNNQTIVINDSFEMLDTTRNLNSAKKMKIEFEDPEIIDPKNLNSTFVMAGKTEPLKQTIKFENQNGPVSRPLTDGTNTMNRDQRTINFADKGELIIVVIMISNLNDVKVVLLLCLALYPYFKTDPRHRRYLFK